ncbi:terminase family protein [bacterium]|nr:terminase family protein [bacterium]
MADKSKYYLGNENLPTTEAKYEYTAENVRELKKCKNNLLHFAQHYFFIINIDSGREVISLRRYQKRIMRKMRDNRFVIIMSSRQSGKTTLMTIYALWMACFNNDQRIVIVANKENTAKDIFQRVRMAYEELPNWVKPGVKEYGKESMSLANGSKIGISTTTGTAARGMSCNVLILDELAFIENHIVDEFWKSVYPTISSSKKSKIFIASTPNGTDNLFHKLYTGAANGTNGWMSDRVTWDQVPGRDDKWKEENIKLLGSREAFDQEFGCMFIQAGDNMLDEGLLATMNSTCMPAEHVLDDGAYNIWKLPESNKCYAVGVDVSEGVNSAASCVQIVDITDPTNIEQVACYHSNTINPYDFTQKLHSILMQWGQPLALIERNSCGAQVVDLLNNNYQYPHLVTYTGTIQAKNRVGIIAHTNTKYRGVVNMRYWVNESKCVTIRDRNFVNELKTFVRNANGTWGHIKADGVYDDRVIGMMWSLFALNEDIVDKYFVVKEKTPNGKPMVIEPIYSTSQLIDGVESMDEGYSGLPTMFGTKSVDDSFTDQQPEVSWLSSNGWTAL